MSWAQHQIRKGTTSWTHQNLIRQTKWSLFHGLIACYWCCFYGRAYVNQHDISEFICILCSAGVTTLLTNLISKPEVSGTHLSKAWEEETSRVALDKWTMTIDCLTLCCRMAEHWAEISINSVAWLVHVFISKALFFIHLCAEVPAFHRLPIGKWLSYISDGCKTNLASLSFKTPFCGQRQSSSKENKKFLPF